MGVVMNMNSYEIESDHVIEDEYGEEVLCSGWNPALSLASQQHAHHWTDRHLKLPTSLATTDAEVFLQKMYAFLR